MNWKTRADEIFKKFENAKNVYNENVLRQKEKEYTREAQDLLAEYREQKSKRIDVVDAEIKAVNEKIEKIGKAPIFNLDHYFNYHEIKSEYGSVLDRKKVIDVTYIEGIRYLTDYVRKTLNRVTDVEDYSRAVSEILGANNEQALTVLHELVLDGYYPSFVPTEDVERNNLSTGANLAGGLKAWSHEFKEVTATHEKVKNAYKKATYPKELYALEEKVEALKKESFKLKGFTGGDDTELYLNNVVSRLSVTDQFFR